MKYNVTLNGNIYEVDVTETSAVVTGVKQVPVNAAPVTAPIAAPATSAAPAVSAAPAANIADGTPVKAPMPGTILAVKAPEGTAVKSGDVVVVLEAMKMENDIVAPCDGTVKSIVAAKGASVNTDDVIAVIG